VTGPLRKSFERDASAGAGGTVAGLTRPGLLGFRIAPIASQGLDWPKLDAIWALTDSLDVFSAGWMSDHVTDASVERGGGAFESLTTAAALAHRVPGKWIGIAVLANTFRHPAIVAKAATVIDNATGGRFILGLGAGWHEGEHEAFGIPLPPMPERFARYESAVATIAALFSEAAREPPGVTRDDPYYPLRDATMDPQPVRPGGPALWLGGQRRRGIALAARYAEGWIMPGNRAGDVAYFIDRRDAILRALETAGRNPEGFAFAAQVNVSGDPPGRRQARDVALEFLAAGADHITLGVPGREGPAAVSAMAREVAEPVRDAARPGRLP
jgi:alkanesulfonate monooxygenase SsuD/methylene tetrahydromethanopterin reductase-like flavin-dependent oxidoreductase (luciferase family)